MINNYKCKAIFRAYQTDFFRAYVGGRCEQPKRPMLGAARGEKGRGGGREGGREVGRGDRERNGREEKRGKERNTIVYTFSLLRCSKLLTGTVTYFYYRIKFSFHRKKSF